MERSFTRRFSVMRTALKGQLSLAVAVAVSVVLWTNAARAEVGVKEVDYPSTYDNPVAIFWIGALVLSLVVFVGGLIISILKRSSAKSEMSATVQGNSGFSVKNVGPGQIII